MMFSASEQVVLWIYSTADTVDWIYGNTRGMKQGCGDLCTAVGLWRQNGRVSLLSMRRI